MEMIYTFYNYWKYSHNIIFLSIYFHRQIKQNANVNKLDRKAEFELVGNLLTVVLYEIPISWQYLDRNWASLSMLYFRIKLYAKKMKSPLNCVLW